MFHVDRVSTAQGLHLQVAEPDSGSRATIYALHGGGLTGRYWDCPFDPALSLVRLAASQGFRVVFPDRPGHGSNQAMWPSGLTAADEAEMHLAAVTEFWEGTPLLVVGQSAGAIVGLNAAATCPENLIGFDYSGIGISLDLGRQEVEDRRLRFWGPASLYPAETFEPVWRVTVPTTEQDGVASMALADQFHHLAAAVTAPVRITIADHEAWWGPIDRLLVELPAGFTSSVDVNASVEYGAGHNLSIGFAARAYHLSVIAFVERCLRRAGAC